MPQYELIQAGTEQTVKRAKGTNTPLAVAAEAGGPSQERPKGIVSAAARCVPKRQAEGNADDFREQMIAFLPRLSAFAHCLTRNADQRDDLVQETCVRALAHRDQWRPGTRLDSWMFRIAQNLWFDQKRVVKLRGEPVDIDSVGELVQSDGRALMEGRLALAEVLRGLDRLSLEHRVLIALVCVDGLTYNEAADILGLPVGTVMSRLARARLALHNVLNGVPAIKATT